jgi:hypothetical protein
MIAVIFGAFSAHALKARLDVTSLGNWETATRYQFYHVFAMRKDGDILISEYKGNSPSDYPGDNSQYTINS